MSKTCGCGDTPAREEEYELVKIKKTHGKCQVCDGYAENHQDKPVAVICCEGACLRGEVARQAANLLCHTLAPKQTVRVCLGGAFTKDTGQRNLVRNADRVIALEGCFVKCASRMMEGVIEGLNQEVVLADQLYEFDRQLFGIEEMATDEILMHARTVAQKVAATVSPGR